MAVKRLDSTSMQGHGEFLQELQVLGACRHEHLLPVLGFAADGQGPADTVCLVSPLMVGGNLEDRLAMSHADPEAQARLRMLAAPSCAAPAATNSSPSPATSGAGGAGARMAAGGVLCWQDRVRCCAALLRALVYLHTPDPSRCKPSILHRDIKPANLLLDECNNARLADVGLAQIMKPTKTHVSNSMLAGTHGFIDPHYSQTGQFDASADGYAVGVTMMMALTARPAYDASETIVDRCCRVSAAIVADRAAGWPSARAEEFLDIANMLTCSPRRDRISVVDALRRLEEMCLDEGIQVCQPLEGDDRECVMCMCRPRQVRFGCGHRVLCEGCLRHLLARDEPSCPCCQGRIEEDLVVADYIAPQGESGSGSQLRMARLRDLLPCPPANLSQMLRSSKLPWD